MRALVEVTACLPVYRTYIRGLPISETDRRYLERTLDLARQRTTELEAGSHAFAFIRSVLLLNPPSYAQDQLDDYLRFVMRWQQFTGPVMAKGLEDTAFYVHNSLISRNEVGSDPLRETPPLDLAGFHRFNEQRLAQWPHSLNATSTHDTKRGEDVRARVNVLSELPAEWAERLPRWSRWNTDKKTVVDGKAVPTPGEEVLIYQSLLGAWPLEPVEQQGFCERFKKFVIKAAREAKIYTGWIRHHAEHERALVQFAGAILDQSGRFWADFIRFHRKIAFHGAQNGLSQVLLKITAPGVPDFYQGSELWNLCLVDPDNRRPVDFRSRVAMLEELRKGADKGRQQLLRELCHNWKDGKIKLYLTDKALDFRRERASLFLEGDYVPMEATGEKANCVCAFARRQAGQWSVTVAPRWTTKLTSSNAKSLNHLSWGDTMLSMPDAAPKQWRDVLTGEVFKTTDSTAGARLLGPDAVLRQFPVALLEGVDGQ
jgi:(1->4)-alpha-D-glucan 1-alpha-D-glucosylmutase